MLGKVDGGFESQVAYSTVYDSYVIAVCAGDFNSDGILDIAGANYYRGNITILTGNKSLAIRNVTSTGYSISTARGNLTDTSDVDYWSFSGSVGDRFILAVDNPFNPNDSGLYYRIYNPVGSDIGGFYSDSRGYGQYSFTISSSGRHYIRVSYNYNYFGEYRFNLVKVPPQIQVETEDNNSLNNANVLNFALIGNNRVANITGVIHINDTAGDYFKIGNLSYGSSINLSLFQPDDYKFPSILEIYNQSGQLLTNTSVTGTNLSYNIPIGGDSTYYARVYSGQVGFSNIKRSALNINAQQVRVPNNNILNFGTNDFSVETLIYVSPLTLGYNTYYEIVSKSAYYYNNAGWSLDINTYGIYPYYRAIFLNTGQTAGGNTDAASELMYPGRWYHLAGIRSNGVLYIYVNGKLSGVNTNTQSALNVNNNLELLIGRGNWNSAFPGVMAEVRLWNRAISAEEINTNMFKSLTGNENGLVVYYPMNQSTGTTVLDITTNNLNGTFNGSPYWVDISPDDYAPPGTLASYRLEVKTADITPPYITGDSFPTNSGSTSDIINTISLSFSEDMNPATITNAANYDLRSAGADMQFGTADDEIYSIMTTYSSGLLANYIIQNGPLQPGIYRFIVSSNISDTANNIMGTNYIKQFTVVGLPFYANENRNNNTLDTATSLAGLKITNNDGSFTMAFVNAASDMPNFIVNGLFNNDTNKDLAVFCYSGNLNIFLGNGNGTFNLFTNYYLGYSVQSGINGDFNSDGKEDLAVLNYNNNTMYILLGNNDGTFNIFSTNATGQGPINIKSADINGDGRIDLAVANYNSGNITIYLGNGDGTFQNIGNITSGAGTRCVELKDINKDGKTDIIAVNENANNIVIRLGNGDGSFGDSSVISVARLPRYAVVVDVDNDSNLDIAVVSDRYDVLEVIKGNGNGTFSVRKSYSPGINNTYFITAADINNDGFIDLIISEYSSDRLIVMQNNGNGEFNSVITYSLNNIAATVADFNNDNVLDIAVADYYYDNIRILLGNRYELLMEDPAGSGIRVGFGRGKLLDTSDIDFWSFSANAGDKISVAMETPGSPNASSLYYTLIGPNGGELYNYYSDYRGYGQMPPITAPASGRYTLRVRYSYSYFGEYRVRITVAPPSIQFERENNNNIGEANEVQLTQGTQKLIGRALGYIGIYETSDFYKLPNLESGTTINLSLLYPTSSRLAGAIEVFNQNGALMATLDALDRTNLSWTVPEGGDGNYYARIFYAGNIPAVSLSGQPEYSLRFDGADDWVRFNSGVIPSSGDFTVEAWVYGESAPGYREVISQGSAGNAFYLGYDYNKNIRVGDGWQSAPVLFPLYQWVHIAVVKTASNTYLYTNGVLAAVRGSAIPNPTQTTALRIGRQYGGYEEYWYGNIDEVRVWNVARSGAEILQTMTNRLTGSEQGLVGYWRFDEGAGRILTDSSSTGANGTILNGALWAGTTLTNNQPNGIMAQYLMNVELVKTQALVLVSSSLPPGGVATTAIVDRVVLGFSSELNSEFNILNKLKIFGGHNYLLTDSAMRWVEAEYVATGLGGHLVAINSEAENEFVRVNFAQSLPVWIGLTDEGNEGVFRWSSGEPVTFTRWNNGEPNNSGGEDYVQLYTTGYWNDLPYSSTLYGVIEIAGNDSDGDGFVDSVDPYPNDPFNGFRLQSAGMDNIFDTADDEYYRLVPGQYSGGTNLTFAVMDGPLQPGNYRLTTATLFRDKYLNPIIPVTRYFVVTNLDGFTIESRSNDVAEVATPVTFVESIAGLKSGFCRGAIGSGSDVDYWSFSAQAGQKVVVCSENPGNPSGSSLSIRLETAGGGTITSFNSDNNGLGQSAIITIQSNGTYYVRVAPNSSYQGEYRIKVVVVDGPQQIEQESNDSLASANPISLIRNNDNYSGNVAGYIRTVGDADWYNIGIVSNGYTIYVSVRQPVLSKFAPVVGVYNAAGVYMAESGQSRPNDGVAEVRITQTGNYYIKVNSDTPNAGLQEEYVVDIQVAPSGALNFANLVVASVNPPTNAVMSGEPITFSYEVVNTGNSPTDVSSWSDRVVISLNKIYGDGDDILLAIVPHTGVLGNGSSYTVTNSAIIPHGVSGNYYLIVQADAFNAVNEFVLKGDNTLASDNAFLINLAPYPDIVVEGLQAITPQSGSVYNIKWVTVNRGTGAAAGGFKERVIVKNETLGTVLLNLERAINDSLPVNGAVTNNLPVAITEAGSFTVIVITDSRNDIYEFNQNGHASAEQNLFTTSFAITQTYNVAITVNPPEAGFVSGAGSYPSGSSVTVTAVANTNVMPYRFVNWLEDGVFQSASTNYTFTIIRSRNLVANFGLPSYQLSASNNPPTGGTVLGQGIYVYGSTNTLVAIPSQGYLFSHWSENGVQIGVSTQLVVVVKSNRVVVANYSEANPIHYVTTATVPPGIATVAGGGIYSNGQVAAISAPLSITNPPYIYRFKEFKLNGVFLNNSNAFSKIFSTLDPSNMNYVAYYDPSSILPVVTNTLMSHQAPVPATSNFVLTLQFDRVMNANVAPLIAVTNPGAAAQAVFSQIGYWTNRAASNDTFVLPGIVFGAGTDGTNYVYVSGAIDTNGLAIEATNILKFVVDATPPAAPTLVLSGSNSVSATVSWQGYVAPQDLAGFRVYISTNNFNSVAGLNNVAWLSASVRSYTYYNLKLDTTYYVAVVAVDVAGNAIQEVTPLSFILRPALPPSVAITVTSVGADSARISWQNYSTSELIGFNGFKLYYETNNFGNVSGLTARQVLGVNDRSVVVSNLNRLATYYFAVVGVNINGEFNPLVTTMSWQDPYAGIITNNLTIGEVGQELIIYKPIIITNGATATIPPRTTLRFMPGTKIVVEQGAINASGSALDPIILTSANDIDGGTPQAGDWGGVELRAGAGGSVLRHIFIKYGNGLTINGCAPTIEALTTVYNGVAGLAVLGNATLNTKDGLIAYNAAGLVAGAGATVFITNSVIKNNLTNAVNQGAAVFTAVKNWWGSADLSDITNTISGSVNYSEYLLGEPLLTPAIRIQNNLTQVGSRSVNLEVACRTAESMRFSENSVFPLTPFIPFSRNATFVLSDGGGEKTVYAQFRSVTGNTNPPISISVTYITAGPVITSFNLTEGMILRRPLVVNGTATATLGMAAIEFYIDNNLISSVAGGSYSQRLDVRNIANGIHRVKLVARDNFGNFAVSERNVVVAVEPPSAPAITSPQSGIVISSNRMTFIGSAEPFISVSLTRGGATLGLTQAGADGQFAFTNVALIEGANNIVASAFDEIGSASGVPCVVVVDSGPPAAVVMNEPFYSQRDGLYLSWRYKAEGERATRFRVLWHTNQFTMPQQASGQSAILTKMDYTLKGLPDGVYYFGVVGYDEAGNESALSELISYNYDATPPRFTIVFNKTPPVGVGVVQLTVTASEQLKSVPNMTIRYAGGEPVGVTLSPAAGLNSYVADLNITPITRSGLAEFRVSGVDLAGNVFEGAPQGAPFIIDVTPPVGRIVCAPVPPIQITNQVDVSVNLTLSEPQKAETQPLLAFKPPLGTNINIQLNGSGTNWSGILRLEPSMGSGFGSFTLQARDALENVGQYIEAGAFLEVYNTDVPTPPAAPTGLMAVAKPGGYIQLSWNAVTNAESYRVYSEAGSNAVVPTVIVADGISTNSYIDLPPTDGSYRYVVTALRRGAESAPSAVRIVVSDRTPPAAPTNVVAQLTAQGVIISWEKGAGENPYEFRVYRNNSLIQRTTSETNAVDRPPRGLNAYTVSAVDAVGNEALSDVVTIEQLVGAVDRIDVVVENAPQLRWEVSDPAAVAFNIYRNGIKQNSQPITGRVYTDSFAIGNRAVVYEVRALNSTNAEGPPRSVTVYPLSVNLVVGRGQTNGLLVTKYFDEFRVSVTNLATDSGMPLDNIQLLRTLATKEGYSRQINLPVNLQSNSGIERYVVLPSAREQYGQAFLVKVVQATADPATSVTYQNAFTFDSYRISRVPVEISANEQPISGGLASFDVKIYNRSDVPIDVVLSKNQGADPGDLYISVKNMFGQEVNRVQYNGMPAGIMMAPDGRAFVRIPSDSFKLITVSNVLIPASLGTNAAYIEAVVEKIYNKIAVSDETVSGPLSGSLVSALIQTPYYGTANTDKQFYANNESVIITGQAIDRVSGQPKPNAPLKIGFFTQGYRFYKDVMTDENGNYQFVYEPQRGLSGSIKIWAAHPDIYDVLNQAEIKVYRIYVTPQQFDIRMSKNGSIDFSVTLVNPGDEQMSNFSYEFRAYTMEGTNRIAISSVTGSALIPEGFGLASRERRNIQMSLGAAVDAPDTAIVEFTVRSGEGASATVVGNVTLLPAVPVLSVVDPAVGYVEMSVNRGDFKSRSITVVNRGMNDLSGAYIIPPTNTGWIRVNMPIGQDGLIHLPNIPVGGSNTFVIVVAPPQDATLDYHEDSLVIGGTNLMGTFKINIFALVTSSKSGNVRFFVDNILTYPVPNATVRIKNLILNTEFTATTDANGYTTITNLQEGDWSYLVTAPGHSPMSGTVTVEPDQTQLISVRLTRNLVTVNFTVEPVPFTDKYEIKIEQTFETHVPVPVLVVTPPMVKYENVPPGFESTIIAIVKNAGLLQLNDVIIEGTELPNATLVPLIEYIPVLLPQESIEVPLQTVYIGGTNQGRINIKTASNKSGATPRFNGADYADCITGGLGGLADFLQDISTIMARFSGDGQCADLRGALKAAAGLVVIYSLFCSPGFSPLGFLPSPCPSVPWPISFAIGLVTCLAQQLTGPSSSGGEAGGTYGTGSGYGFYSPVCFVEGTSVLMADGKTKPIEMVKIGDWVRTGYSEKEKAQVRLVTQRTSDELYRIEFGSKESGRQDVTATGDHAFWVDGKGWTLARQLAPGDWLMQPDGRRAVIKSVNRLKESQKVYSLVLKEDQAFFANGVLVRDRCGLSPDELVKAFYLNK
jgi:hypothetical protein